MLCYNPNYFLFILVSVFTFEIAVAQNANRFKDRKMYSTSLYSQSFPQVYFTERGKLKFATNGKTGDTSTVAYFTDSKAISKRDEAVSARKAERKLRKLEHLEHCYDPVKPGDIFLRGLGEVAATHAISLAVLLSTPKEYTKWEYGMGKELIENADDKFTNAWSSAPVNDKDDWNTNYVAHPYVGSIYYNFVRSQGASPLGSFLFSCFASFSWEYGVEAMFEHPSIQDLWTTPILGSLVGEATHQITLMLAKNDFTLSEKLLILLINPAFYINHAFHLPDEKRRHQLQQWNTNR